MNLLVKSHDLLSSFQVVITRDTDFQPSKQAGVCPAEPEEGGVAVCSGTGDPGPRGGVSRLQLPPSPLVARDCASQLLPSLQVSLVVEERQEILERLLVQLHGFLHVFVPVGGNSLQSDDKPPVTSNMAGLPW